MNHTISLIPLTVEARGEIIANNLPEFREMIREALGNINRDLRTDEDFGQAELDCKALKQAEDTVRSAALQAFDEKVKALVDDINATAEEIRIPRLELEKLIAARKEEVKRNLVNDALAQIICASRLTERTYGKSIADAIKGKRTITSMESALQVQARIHNAEITKSRKAIETFERAHGPDMTMDREELECRSVEVVEAELRRRFEAKKSADEKKRLDDEAAKVKAELVKSQAAKINPHDLPVPPKIGSIPAGKAAIAGPAAAEEWLEITATVKAAFGMIRVHRERLEHVVNKDRIAAFGSGVNALWKEINQEEVAS